MTALRLLPSPLERDLAASKDPEAVLAAADEAAREASVWERMAHDEARDGHSELAAVSRAKAGNLRSRSRMLIRHANRLVEGNEGDGR